MRRTISAVLTCLAAAGALALTACSAAGKPNAAPTVTVTVPGPVVSVTTTAPAPHVTVTTTAQPQAVMSQDGVYVVGLDIKHGIYHTTGASPSGSNNCYYALLSSTNTNDIIDNNNVTGPATITVGAGVKAVDTAGCNPWRKIG
ncbi:MAG TPA: hypothetical protein VNF47_21500 [Streptosporangiaceae bacterium]|nr:hypothetical protein [Streptosporangiaceae bacterium]